MLGATETIRNSQAAPAVCPVCGGAVMDATVTNAAGTVKAAASAAAETAGKEAEAAPSSTAAATAAAEPAAESTAAAAAGDPADEESSCCSGHGVHAMKERSPKEKKDLISRLKRIEGQIRGIQRMVENDAYCPDILMQSTAASSALNSFNKVLLSSHIKSCVREDVRSGNDETIDELVKLLQKMMK